MRRSILAVAAALAAAVLMGALSAGAQSGPSAGVKLAGGLVSPRGMALGPDGMLYVAEAGSGGAEATVTVGGMDYEVGHTGRISKIDPATGTRSTVADGLPSVHNALLGTVGPTDVAFIGDQLYYLLAHGGAAWGLPGEPSGVYAVSGDGSVTLVADVGSFVDANPVRDQLDGTQLDIDPGGNLYAMVVRNGAFYIVNGNQNQVIVATPDGDVSRLAELRGHPVSTGITYDPDGGPFYVAYFGRFPFPPEHGQVASVGATTGDVHVIAGGYKALIDVGIGPRGQLYALQMADAGAEPFPPFTPGSGRVLRVNTDGTLTPVVTGLSYATSMLFDGAKLYVTANGAETDEPGEVWVINDITNVPPPAAPPAPAPQPTATPSGPITPPATGTGAAGGSSSPHVVALAALGLALAGLLATRRALTLRR